MANVTQPYLQRAIALHQSNQASAAIPLYLRHLSERPDDAEALHLAGLAFAQCNDLDSAHRHLAHAVQVKPKSAIFLNNLAEVERKRGDLEDARNHYHQALDCEPGLTAAHYNLGLLYRQLRDNVQSEHHYRRALQLDNNHIKARYNLGNLYLETGRYSEANDCYQTVLALQPAHIDALLNLGNVLQLTGLYERAIERYEQALALVPGHQQARSNLALAQQLSGRIEEAKSSLLTASKGGADKWWLALRSAALYPDVAPSGGDIQRFHMQLLHDIERHAGSSRQLEIDALHTSGLEPAHGLIYHGLDELPLKRAYASLYQGCLPQLDPVSNSAKPHVGFVVTQGHEGVFLKCMGGILRYLSQDTFRISVVCHESGRERLRTGICREDIGYIIIPLRLDLAREVLVKEQFDLLHYWEVGTDSSNYFLPLLRPAAIQCATWGWPSSSGMDAMQYFISSSLLDSDSDARHYSEQLICLPTLPTYYFRPKANKGITKSRRDFGFSDDALIFMCQQNLRKVHPDFDALIGEILRREHRGIVVFIEDRQPHIGRLLRQRLSHGLPDLAGRIVFVAQQSWDDYLALIALSDVIIDTVHYGGGANTIYDAFSLGKVVITLPGRLHRGRYCTATYHSLGMDIGISASSNDYIEKAVMFATETDMRMAYEAEIIHRSDALFDNMCAVHELKEFFDHAIATIRKF